MAEEEIDSGSMWGSQEGSGCELECSNPENGSNGIAIRLHWMAEAALFEHFGKLVRCLVANIELNKLPAAKMLIDLPETLRPDKLQGMVVEGTVLRSEECQSLAEVLKKSCEEQGVEMVD
jgi:hypothetical protein